MTGAGLPRLLPLPCPSPSTPQPDKPLSTPTCPPFGSLAEQGLRDHRCRPPWCPALQTALKRQTELTVT